MSVDLHVLVLSFGGFLKLVLGSDEGATYFFTLVLSSWCSVR